MSWKTSYSFVNNLEDISDEIEYTFLWNNNGAAEIIFVTKENRRTAQLFFPPKIVLSVLRTF